MPNDLSRTRKLSGDRETVTSGFGEPPISTPFYAEPACRETSQGPPVLCKTSARLHVSESKRSGHHCRHRILDVVVGSSGSSPPEVNGAGGGPESPRSMDSGYGCQALLLEHSICAPTQSARPSLLPAGGVQMQILLGHSNRPGDPLPKGLDAPERSERWPRAQSPRALPGQGRAPSLPPQNTFCEAPATNQLIINYPFIYLSNHPPIHLSNHPSTYHPSSIVCHTFITHPSIHPSNHPRIIHLPTNFSTSYPFTDLSIHLSTTHLSTHISSQ
ncbi:PREDICTED: uncharacterized protein LOC102825719 [Chrysochloris asiatica]|uniref:Uncharacterized protein LOC102825719 n=1 Tax=Chrysochloris asiatica TaxID=185453 RepID=A0A9B0WZY9_CHRAS|nr:PREDICTED: uncharacterized protein LOC102825719 [Chrysochloris asiatica]